MLNNASTIPYLTPAITIGMDGTCRNNTFEGDVELNMQQGLAPEKVQDWFEPFNGAFVHPTCGETLLEGRLCHGLKSR
ncbi:hypothetical protein [Arthrobacter sp. fls2-241-R2A-200]|uniref:hypothetical protein n=1 Tax=Arthrobacter sp. fls2-241-R2A-200 TaxID=3040281 RepID=UPI00255019B6|nr:hypothetical protein [Arthrobacter sp. fls2-241-R2A-200]